MAERKRKTRERTKRPARSQSEQAVNPGADEALRKTELRLDTLDAAIDDLVNRRTASAGQSVVASEQQPHRTQNPLSDEAIVKRFIQTSGE